MPTAGRAESADARRGFAKVVNAFSRNRGVTVGQGRGFGLGALKVDGKIFAMLSSEERFVAKLPNKRVDELVGSSPGRRFEPRPGKPMKQLVGSHGISEKLDQTRQRCLRVCRRRQTIIIKKHVRL